MLKISISKIPDGGCPSAVLNIEESLYLMMMQNGIADSVSAVRHLAFLLAVTLSTARLKLSKFIFLFYGRSTQLCLSGSSNVLLNMQLSLADLGFFKAEVTLGTRASEASEH